MYIYHLCIRCTFVQYITVQKKEKEKLEDLTKFRKFNIVYKIILGNNLFGIFYETIEAKK